MVLVVKNPPASAGDEVRPLGREESLEKEMATHSSILAWRIPWPEGPGRLRSLGSPRVRHDWVCTCVILLTRWFQTSSRQNGERMNFCCFQPHSSRYCLWKAARGRKRPLVFLQVSQAQLGPRCSGSLLSGWEWSHVKALPGRMFKMAHSHGHGQCCLWLGASAGLVD